MNTPESIDPEEPFVGDQLAPSETVWPYDYRRSYAPSKPIGGVYPQQTGHPTETPGRTDVYTQQEYGAVEPTQPLSDEEIRAQLSARLNGDLRLSGNAELSLFVINRIVTITGTARNRRLKTLIGQYAWQQPGVADVHNNVNVLGYRRSVRTVR